MVCVIRIIWNQHCANLSCKIGFQIEFLLTYGELNECVLYKSVVLHLNITV